MKKIVQHYLINAPVAKIWQALVDPKDIESWGGGPAKMNDKEGAKFSLWGGDIHGRNIEIIPQKRLVQEWFGGKWDNPSTLTFTLTKKPTGGTMVDLLHENVPISDAKDIEQGWKDYYMGPLKAFVEKE